MSESKTGFEYNSPGQEPVIRVVLMPKDTNAHGTIFGGVILSYIDIAAAKQALAINASHEPSRQLLSQLTVQAAREPPPRRPAPFPELPLEQILV